MIRIALYIAYLVGVVLSILLMRRIFRSLLPATAEAADVRKEQAVKAVKALGPKIVEARRSMDMGIASRLLPKL